MLAGRTGADNVVVRGARVLDPVEGVDATLDVRIDNGVVARICATQIGEQLETNEHRVIEAAGGEQSVVAQRGSVALDPPDVDAPTGKIAHEQVAGVAVHLPSRHEAIARSQES